MRVVGHDIGLMVAYAYAVMHPQEVEKLSLMDAFLQVVCGWEAVYNNPGIWHLRFDGKLVASDVTVVVLKNAGHWILEESPEETMAALTRFLQKVRMLQELSVR